MTRSRHVRRRCVHVSSNVHVRSSVHMRSVHVRSSVHVRRRTGEEGGGGIL